MVYQTAVDALGIDGGVVTSFLAALGIAEDSVDAKTTRKLLLRRLTNSVGGEFRKQLISLTGLERNEGALGIRTRLKVEQVKSANKDLEFEGGATKLNAKQHLTLDESVVHQLLRVIASERPSELSSGTGMTAAVLQAALRAYVPADEAIRPALLKEKAKGVKKKDLEDALVKALTECPSGFARFHLLQDALK